MRFRRVWIAGLTCLVMASGAVAQSNIGRSGAQFLKVSPSARGVALGGAYVAVASNAEAAYYNPAGLASLSSTSVHLSLVNYVADIDFTFLALAFPAMDGIIGLQFSNMSTSDMKVTTIDDPTNESGQTFGVGSWMAGVSFGKSWTDKLSIGFTAKYVRESIADMSSGVVAFDLGTVYKIGFNNWRIAANLSNFAAPTRFEGGALINGRSTGDPNQADIVTEDRSENYNLPLTFRLATAYDMKFSDAVRLTAALEGAHPTDAPESVSSGAEVVYSMDKMEFAIRGGYRFISSETFTVITLTDEQSRSERPSEEGIVIGFGLTLPVLADNLSLDYAWQDYGLLGSNQRFSLTMGF